MLIAWSVAHADPTVIVTARELAVGETITVADLYAVEVPPADWPMLASGGFTDPSAVVGRQVTERILVHEVVLPRRIGLPQPAAAPTAGHVAVAARVSEPARTGDRVDLVRPGQAGCRVVSDGLVLRVGDGAVLVEIPERAAGAAVAAELAATAPAPRERCRGRAPVTTPLPPPPTEPRNGVTTLPLATRDLAPGDALTPDAFTYAVIDERLAPDVPRVEPGGTALAPIARGEPIRAERVAAGELRAMPPVVPAIAVATVPGTPWWPGDPVALTRPDRCGTPAAVLATLTVAPSGVLAVGPADQQGAELLATTFSATSVTLRGDEVALVSTAPAPAGTWPILVPTGWSGTRPCR